MHSIIRHERAAAVLGVAGRFFNVVARDDDGRILNQRWISEERRAPGYDKGCTIQVEIRFDDECRNGRESFAITGEVRDPRVRRDSGIVACGCLHDAIAQAFPELAPLIRWHLTSTDGPMHYEANTVYLAGDRDHWGLRKGEPHPGERHQEVRVRFGTSPISHKVGRRLAAFMRDLPATLSIVEVPHVNRPGETYKFCPKFTFEGLPCEWHTCPFDSRDEAEEWRAALLSGQVEWIKRPTLFGEGKARDLDGARSVAVWPDATDEQLTAEPDQLRAMLRARLPALLAEFRADVERAGFLWPVERSAA